MKKIKLLLCAISLFALCSCGAGGASGSPESTVKTFVDKTIEINQMQSELFKKSRAKEEVDIEGFKQIKADAEALYRSLHCYEGASVMDSESSTVGNEIYTVVAATDKATTCEIVSTTMVDDKTAVVELSHDGRGGNIYFWVVEVDGAWLIETAPTPQIKDYVK